MREAYGPTEPEKLDINRTVRANAPIFVFIHGGAWLDGEAKNYAYAAEMFIKAGAHFVALDFVAIAAASGDLRVMADQVRRGVAWVYKNAASFGGDARLPSPRRKRTTHNWRDVRSAAGAATVTRIIAPLLITIHHGCVTASVSRGEVRHIAEHRGQ